MNSWIELDVLHEWYFRDFFGKNITKRYSWNEYFGVLMFRWKSDLEERDVRMKLFL